MKRRNMHLGASPIIFKHARNLRNNPKEAESVLWQYLRKRQIEGTRFRRQHPINKYIADFYAHKYKLIIEVDGDQHQDQDQVFYDCDRDQNLIQYAVTTLRFTNYEVLHQIDIVLSVIRNRIIYLKASKRK